MDVADPEQGLDVGIVVKREEGTRRMLSLDREGMGRRYPGLLDAILAAPEPEPTAPL